MNEERERSIKLGEEIIKLNPSMLELAELDMLGRYPINIVDGTYEENKYGEVDRYRIHIIIDNIDMENYEAEEFIIKLKKLREAK